MPLRTPPSGQIESHRPEKSDKAQEHPHDKRSSEQPERPERPRALAVFKQELQVAIESRFRAKIAISQPAYAQQQDDPDSGDVSREALGSARQVVSEAPTNSGKALISFRAVVQETASYVRETLGAPDDISDVDDAVALVGKGLNELETELAANQESVATALEINTQSKQRSTIKIRTQEGDIVKLSIKRFDQLSASDTSKTEDGVTSTTTEIEVSSRSRLMLSVDGDLNDDELAAIQNVFAQAEAIANQFFGGDIAAAFDLAAGFEFDAEQLARVNMGFRSYQSTDIAYTETTRLAPAAAPAIEPEPAANEDAPIANTPLAAPTIIETAEIEADDAAILPIPPTPSSPPAPGGSSLSDFFGLVSDFLRSVGEGFEGSDGSGATSIQLHYSESFKLTMLSAVLNVVAPEESDDAASTASALVGSIAGAPEQESEQ